MKRALVLSALLAVSAVPAIAADIPVKAPPPTIPVQVMNWTGFYIGLNGGYSWGDSSRELNFVNAAGATIVPAGGVVTTGGTELDGGLFGGQIGYNWQSGNWVFGFETDAQWTNQRGGRAFAGTIPLAGGGVLTGAAVEQKLQWFGTLRGRVGALVGPTALLYATGGLAYGSLETTVALAGITAAGTSLGASASGSGTRAGWTVGGGIEWMFSPNWTAKFEYLYMDIGSTTNTAFVTTAAGTTVGANVTSRVTDNIIRGGINYKF